MDYIVNALSQYRQPAAMFEECGIFLAANEPMKRFAGQALGDLDDDWSPGEVGERFGLDVDAILSKGSHVQRLDATHLVRSSHIDAPEPLHARPILILVTLHEDTAGDTSELDHNRIKISLAVNEMGEFALRALETTMVQVSNALAAQRRLLGDFNTQVAKMHGGFDELPGTA